MKAKVGLFLSAFSACVTHAVGFEVGERKVSWTEYIVLTEEVYQDYNEGSEISWDEMDRFVAHERMHVVAGPYNKFSHGV